MNRRDALKTFAALFAGAIAPWPSAAPATVSYDTAVRYMPNASREQIAKAADRIAEQMRLDILWRFGA